MLKKMSKKTAKKGSAGKVAGAAPKAKKAPYTHIDRSNGTLLREKDLNKKKPWLSPVSGQATVEALTDEDRETLGL